MTSKVISKALAPAAPYDAMAYTGMQVNGSCDVSQANGTSALTVPGYIIDGWLTNSSGVQTFSAAQTADAPPGYNNSLKMTVTGANASPGSTDFLMLTHKIEGYRTARLAFGTASASPVSIGFWTKAHRPGAYSGSAQNGTQVRACPFTFIQNAADTWEYKTVTIPGDVAGTWAGASNAPDLILRFTLMAGSSNQAAPGVWAAATTAYAATGTINGCAATTDYFAITGLIILPGIELPSASLAPFIMRQRYYRQMGPNCGPYGFANTSTSVYLFGSWYPSMRATPTVSATGVLTVDDNTVGTHTHNPRWA